MATVLLFLSLLGADPSAAAKAKEYVEARRSERVNELREQLAKAKDAVKQALAGKMPKPGAFGPGGGDGPPLTRAQQVKNAKAEVARLEKEIAAAPSWVPEVEPGRLEVGQAGTMWRGTGRYCVEEVLGGQEAMVAYRQSGSAPSRAFLLRVPTRDLADGSAVPMEGAYAVSGTRKLPDGRKVFVVEPVDLREKGK